MKSRAKKWLLIALGWAIVLAGIVLMPLPGPGLFIVIGGLYFLSRQSEWVRKRLEQGRRLLKKKWPEGYEKLEHAQDEARKKRRRVRELLHR